MGRVKEPTYFLEELAFLRKGRGLLGRKAGFRNFRGQVKKFLIKRRNYLAHYFGEEGRKETFFLGLRKGFSKLNWGLGKNF